MRRSQPIDQDKRYRITVQGRLSAHWERWFDGMQIESRAALDGQVRTTVTGTLKDQSALQGALRALHGLGLTLVSVETLDQDVAASNAGLDVEVDSRKET